MIAIFKYGILFIECHLWERKLALHCRLWLDKTTSIIIVKSCSYILWRLHLRSKNKDFKPLFYFYPNDITRCIKGTRRKWNKYCLDVPNVGPIPRGTNLIAHEIRTLEEIGFQLQQRQHMAHKQLFGNNEVVVAQIQNIFNQLILIITSYTRMAEPLVTTQTKISPLRN